MVEGVNHGAYWPESTSKHNQGLPLKCNANQMSPVAGLYGCCAVRPE